MQTTTVKTEKKQKKYQFGQLHLCKIAAYYLRWMQSGLHSHCRERFFMRCPVCGFQDDKVIDSRVVKEGFGVRRRRECLSCSHRFSTYESIIQSELKVVKRNHEREDFDADKLRHGIENACYKRPLDPEDINRLIEDVSQGLQRDFEREVASAEIGNRVMEALRKLDQVAYVRFASVYRKFHDVEEFIEEIRSLK